MIFAFSVDLFILMARAGRLIRSATGYASVSNRFSIINRAKPLSGNRFNESLAVLSGEYRNNPTKDFAVVESLLEGEIHYLVYFGQCTGVHDVVPCWSFWCCNGFVLETHDPNVRLATTGPHSRRNTKDPCLIVVTVISVCF